MDCNHARLLLTFARDHADLDQSEADGLEEHLGQCPECAALAGAEQRFDAAMGKAMNAVPLPFGLKERLLAKLRRPRIRWRRWIVSTAAAAVLLLACLISWQTWLAPLQEPDFEDVSLVIASQSDDEDATAAAVENWFENRDLPMAFPRAFKPRRLTSYSIGDFQGRRVPRLEFIDANNGKNVAHVFVLSDRHFNIDAKMPSHLHILQNRNMETFTQAGFLYVMIYTGSLEPFLNAAAFQ